VRAENCATSLKHTPTRWPLHLASKQTLTTLSRTLRPDHLTSYDLASFREGLSSRQPSPTWRKRCRRCTEFRPVAIWGLWVFEPLGKRRKEEHCVG
jgi:hypothetical protein